MALAPASRDSKMCASKRSLTHWAPELLKTRLAYQHARIERNRHAYAQAQVARAGGLAAFERQCRAAEIVKAAQDEDLSYFGTKGGRQMQMSDTYADLSGQWTLHQTIPVEKVHVKAEKNSRGWNYEASAEAPTVERALALLREATTALKAEYGQEG